MSTTSSTPEAALERMERLAATFEEALRGFVARCGAEGVENLHDAMAYALGLDIEDVARRGKRVRPALCLLSAEALGGGVERALPFAIAIELMHNFALVHDDMEDGDIMRRGRDAVWVRYGEAHGINIGDYLLVQTHRALEDLGPADLDPATRLRLMKLLTNAIDHTHIGQALEINARGRAAISMDDYMRIVREKTGYYLAAPIQGGALVAGADEATLEAIGEMAHQLGPLFQIVDDIIDLTDGKGREAIGSDIREGKRSYLVAHASEQATAAERSRLFEILDTPRGETTAEMIDWVAELFRTTGSVEAGLACCERLYQTSLEKLGALPEPLAGALGPVIEHLARRRR